MMREVRAYMGTRGDTGNIRTLQLVCGHQQFSDRSWKPMEPVHCETCPGDDMTIDPCTGLRVPKESTEEPS